MQINKIRKRENSELGLDKNFRISSGFFMMYLLNFFKKDGERTFYYLRLSFDFVHFQILSDLFSTNVKCTKSCYKTQGK